VSKIEDRTQRAREAYWDACGVRESALTAAIEAATRVQITPEAIEAGRIAGDFELNELVQINKALAAALAALGFEVEQ
jgi:ribosomal protein L16/L10AE